MPVKNCILCGNHKAIDSHIIPRCFYPRGEVIKSIPTYPGAYPKRRLKGEYEKLLCKICDGRWGKYDDYAFNVLNGGHIDGLPKILYGGKYVPYIEYNYYKLHTFFVTLLWRAYHAKGELFVRVDGEALGRNLSKAVSMGDQTEADKFTVLLSYFPGFPGGGIFQPLAMRDKAFGTKCQIFTFTINNMLVTINDGEEVLSTQPGPTIGKLGCSYFAPVKFEGSYADRPARDMIAYYPNAFH